MTSIASFIMRLLILGFALFKQLRSNEVKPSISSTLAIMYCLGVISLLNTNLFSKTIRLISFVQNAGVRTR